MYRGPRGAPRSAPSREQQLRTARSLDESSTAMIQFAVNKAKKHPMLVSSYTIGLLLCLFFTGVALSVEQERQFEADLQSIDYHDLNAKQRLFDKSYQEYYSSKGWFSCDARCQHNKNAMESRRHDLEVVKRNTDQQLSDAKAKLGILSSVGVEETRDLFWTRFSQGKRFAQNQSKWDALFVGTL